MKRLMSFSVVLMLSLWAAAKGSVWIDTVHDFGAFSEDMGLVWCTFKAVNTSDEPLAVVSARANCGCTRPGYPRSAVQPGDTLAVRVAYDAKGRPGRFDKKVYVSTGDGVSTTLTVKGTVIGAPTSLSARYPVEAGQARLSTTVIPFGEVFKGRVASGLIKGYNATSDTIVPSVESLPGYIDVNIRPSQVPPGEQFVISATATTDRCREWGFVTGGFAFVPDKGAPPAADISTVVIVREDFSRLTPGERNKAPHATPSVKTLDFGSFKRDSDPLKATFEIRNTGTDPLIVRQVSSPDRSLAISLSSDKIKKGKSASVQVTFSPRELDGAELLNARITIITNDPDNPVQMIRIVGEPL